MNTHRTGELLLELYTCPSDRSAWPRVLDRICHETGARSAVIQLLVRDGERAWSRLTLRDSASEAARTEHERYMGDDVNPRLQLSRQVALPQSRPIIRERDLFAPGDPALAETRERLAAIHLGHFMSANTPLPGQERLALVLHRDLDERRDFDADAESFALELIPHLRQAIRLSEQVDEAQERTRNLQHAINRLRCALVLCEPDGRVCWANRSAESIFAAGSRVRVCGERLVTPSSQETTMLRRKIAQIAQWDDRSPPAERYLVLGRNTPLALQVMMHPIPGEDAASLCGRSAQARVLLVLSCPDEAPALPADLIRHVFALSPAESQVAAAVCSGLTINEYASATGVTVGTARFQLKQVLAKTHAGRQADLVRQICSSVIAQALPAAMAE